MKSWKDFPPQDPDPAEYTNKISGLLTEAQRKLAAQDWKALELIAADMSLAAKALLWECAERGKK